MSRIRHALLAHADDCARLASELDAKGDMPLTEADHRLIRIALLPGIYESFEIAVAGYIATGNLNFDLSIGEY